MRLKMSRWWWICYRMWQRDHIMLILMFSQTRQSLQRATSAANDSALSAQKDHHRGCVLHSRTVWDVCAWQWTQTRYESTCACQVLNQYSIACHEFISYRFKAVAKTSGFKQLSAETRASLETQQAPGLWFIVKEKQDESSQLIKLKNLTL